MDEIFVKGNKYISSKRAAKLSGYAKDYIGQLVRMKKLAGVKFGRAWFIEERGLQSFLKQANNDLEAVGITEASIKHEEKNTQAVNTVPNQTWSSIKYLEDDSRLLPISDSQDTNTELSKNDTPEIDIVQSKLVSSDAMTDLNAEIHDDGVVSDDVARDIPKIRRIYSNRPQMAHSATAAANLDGLRAPERKQSVPAVRASQSKIILAERRGSSGPRTLILFVGALVVIVVVFLIPTVV